MQFLIGAPRPDRLVRRSRSTGENGVALILTLLVMTILFVVVLQLKYSTVVDQAISRNLKDEVVLDLVARGAVERAKALLIVDLEDDIAAAEEESVQGDGSGDESGDGSGGGAGGGIGGGIGGGGSLEDQGGTLTVDSLDEEWAFGDNPPVLGSEAEVRVKVLVVDEDRKFNLLQIFTPDEEDSDGRSYRERARERLTRLLDVFREGRDGDLDRGRAEEITENIVRWCEGQDRDERTFPRPPLKSSEPEEGEEESAFQDTEEKPLLPLTLDELLMINGIDESLYYGYRDGDDWVPGLEDLLTVYTVPSLEPPLEEGEDSIFGGFDLDSDSGSGDSSGSDGAGGGESGSDGSGSGEGGTGEESSTAQSDLGRININTAPEAVLLSLLPNEEFPETRVRDFIEWRDEQLQEISDKIESGEFDSLGGQSALGGFGDGSGDSFGDGFGGSFEGSLGANGEEITYPLSTLDELDDLEFMQDTDRYSSGGDPKEEWKSLLTTKSHVFTITVVVWKPGHQAMAVLSSIVWRFVEDGQAKIIPIVPIRRRSLQGLDMREIEKEMEDEETFGG